MSASTTRTARLRNSLSPVFATLALSVVLAAALAPTAIVRKSRAHDDENEHVHIELRHDRGLRRSAYIEQFADVKLELHADFGGLAATTTYENERHQVVHDWYRELRDDGTPSAIVRTYDELNGTLRSTVEGQFLEQPFESTSEIEDPRRKQTLELAIDEAGVVELVGGHERLFMQEDRDAVVNNWEVALLPNRVVRIGESWTIGTDAIAVERLWGVDLGYEDGLELDEHSVLEDAELTVKFDSLVPVGQTRIAGLAISGEVSYRRVRESFTGDVTTDLLTRLTISGRLRVDVSAGRLTSRTIEAVFERTGRADGGKIVGEGALTDSREYHYSWLFDDDIDNGEDAPDYDREAETELRIAPLARVPDDQLVLARNTDDTARLINFDPETRQFGHALAVGPGSSGFDHLALSADRERVAFSSQLNNALSMSTWNVFVLEGESGKLNQITPEWATGDGVATALEAEATGSVEGRISWYDDERERNRSDVSTGIAKIDQTHCAATIANGAFRIDNVPATSVNLWIQATVFPGDQNRGAVTLSAITTLFVRPNATMDVGTITLTPMMVEPMYAHATWTPEGLAGMLYQTDHVFTAGYPERAWQLSAQFGALGSTPSGFAASPDGKFVALLADPFESPAISIFNRESAEVEHHFKLESGEVAGNPHSRGVWFQAPDTLAWVTCCATPGPLAPFCDVPTLVVADVVNGESFVTHRWPEFHGRLLIDVALSADGSRVYMVIQRDVEGGVESDLYEWDFDTDTTRRITSTHDVTSVAHLGR